MPYPYYPNYNQMYLQQMQNYQQPQQNTQIQNGGFVIVKDINEAQRYPVAPGNSVTFKVESQPYICTKTLGFSQLDQPIFEVFRLVKEDNSAPKEEMEEDISVIEYLPLKDADEIKQDISELRSEIDFIKELVEMDVEGVKDEK